MKRVQFENSNQHEKYPTLADKASRLMRASVMISGSSATVFRRDSLVSRENSHTILVFNELKAKKNQSRHCYMRISRKIDKDSKEKLDKLFNTVINLRFFNDILLFTLISIFGRVNLILRQPKSECYSSNGQVE